MKPTDEVSNLINCLANSEDERQDLWVHYLSGTPIESLNSRLKRIKVEYADDSKLRLAMFELINNPLSEELNQFLLKNFTEYERSIICFLALGLDITKISEIKGISRVRIEQTIATIRYNKCWKEIYGTEEESN